MNKYDERAARGAAVLDRVYGPDWIWNLNFREIDLNSPDDCVIGQVYRQQYWNAQYDRKTDARNSFRYGYDQLRGPLGKRSLGMIWSFRRGFLEGLKPRHQATAWRKLVSDRRHEQRRDSLLVTISEARDLVSS